jgi:hypothetical protein
MKLMMMKADTYLELQADIDAWTTSTAPTDIKAISINPFTDSNGWTNYGAVIYYMP